MKQVLIVIPARYGSTRFPGKALADLGGRPLVVRVAERAAAVGSADRVVVATDDARIADAVSDAGYEAVLTGEHASGSDRVGEVAARIPAGIVVNLQGDEPVFDPADMDRLVAVLREDPGVDISTLAVPFTDPDAWADPNVVKVVCGDAGNALYFSRAPIPGAFPGRAGEPWRRAMLHVGVYAYRAEALKRFLDLPPSPLEETEGLEQLRALEAGLRIRVIRAAGRAGGVDTPQDLERLRSEWPD